MKKDKFIILYLYLVPIFYIPLFVFYFRSSVLLNQFIYYSGLLVVIFNIIISKKLKFIYPNNKGYESIKFVNLLYLIIYIVIAFFAFINSLYQYMPGGV